jgi:hypothetical protein
MIETLNSDRIKSSSPTLNTILMVEDTIKNSPNSVMTIPELKRALPKQVNHNTLMTILDYLEQSNKIVVGLRGITWIQNNNKNLKHVALHGLEL